MKKIIILIIAIILVVMVVKYCAGTGGTSINGYVGTVRSVENNVLVLTSGLKARLLGVDGNRTDVEMFLRSQFENKQVELYADSHDNVQDITDPNGTIHVYAVVVGENDYCINRQVVNEYPDCYHEVETPDSGRWILPDEQLTEKRNLALYMKQRTFLIVTPNGIGTGFFINENGLAVTNWHVLAPNDVNSSYAVLYQDDPNDSKVYSDKKRNFKNILWCDDTDGLDITIMSVDLENNETIPYFNIAKRRPNIGDMVATLGNPHGLTASYSSGVISAFRDDPYNPNRGVQLMQYDMATNGGNSGGPVCDKYGQIVAVVELADRTAQGINYGIDAMQLRQVLDRLGLKYGGK